MHQSLEPKKMTLKRRFVLARMYRQVWSMSWLTAWIEAGHGPAESREW